MLFSHSGKHGAHSAPKNNRRQEMRAEREWTSLPDEPEEAAEEFLGAVTEEYQAEAALPGTERAPEELPPAAALSDDAPAAYGPHGDDYADEESWPDEEDWPDEEEPDDPYGGDDFDFDGDADDWDGDRPRRRRALRHTLPFFLALGALTVFAWLLPLRPSYSVLEKRDLEPFPAFSTSALFSGEWFSRISLWFSDTFPGRETWVQLDTRFAEAYGLQGIAISGSLTSSDDIGQTDKAEDVAAATPAPTPSTVMNTPAVQEVTPAPTPDPADGVDFNISDSMRFDSVAYFGDAGYELYGLIAGNAQQYGILMDQCANKFPDIRVFSMIIPNSCGIMLSYDIYDQLCDIREDTAIRYFYENTSAENLYPVYVYDNLRSHNQEYLYFRTDHHWTALGAWYAYEAWCAVAGFEPVTLDHYSVLEMPGFLGAFYQKRANAAMEENPDTVYAYNPPGDIHCRSKNTGGWFEHDVITDMSNESFEKKYLTFVRGDQPITYIENNDVDNDSVCLLIKDSYGNPFCVYLTQHYHTVVVMDFRNEFPLAQVVQEYGVTDIIFLNELVLSQDTESLGHFASDIQWAGYVNWVRKEW